MVTNVVRHSKASRSAIKLLKKDKTLILEVEDDGVGLSQSDQMKGSGISNLKYRANKMGAYLSIQQVKPRGTKWILEIKL